MNYEYNEYDEEELRRINRHKKKVRNRAIAIIVFILLLAVVIGGISFIIYKFVSDAAIKASISASLSASESAASASEQEDINSIIESLLSEEEEVVDPVEPQETEKTAEELLELEVSNLISQMSIGEKVAGLFIITPEQLSDVELAVKAGEGTKNALSEYAVGGLIYSTDNVLSKEQFKEMTANTKDFAKFKLFTCFDEGFAKEGLLASKLSLDTTKEVKEILDSMDPYNAYIEGKIIADNLSDYGLNSTFGLHNLTIEPSFDEEGNVKESEEKALFGNDWIIAGQMASQAVKALSEEGVVSFASTFPNAGNGDDSNKKTSELTKEQFAENGLNVFKACLDSGLEGIVVGNVYVPNMTKDELPASLSREFMTDYVRIELGFTDAILITDKLSNPEIADYYSAKEACVMAIKAGADMVMCPENFKEAYLGVLEAVSNKEISEERIDQSLMRILKAKYAKGSTDAEDASEANDEE